MKKKPAKQQHSTDQSSRLLLWGLGGIALMLVIIATLYGLSTYAPAQQKNSVAPSNGETQVVRISVEGLDFVPADVTVKAGVPVQFIVDGTRAQGCARYFVFREFGVNKVLERGDNVFEFTPTTLGDYEFSCTMRMVLGKMHVVE